MSTEILEAVRSLQLQRTAIIHLLSDPNMAEIVEGCYVRVLLELENHTEDYRVGRVRGIDQGTPYGGFTQDTSVQTAIHLVLELSGDLHSINGTSFQLNSVSNSPITQAEMQDWANNTTFPPLEEMQARAQQLRPFIDRNRRRTQTSSAVPSQQAQVSQQAVSEAALQSVPSRRVSPQSGGNTNNALQQTRVGARSSEQAEPEELTMEQIVRIVQTEMREKHSLFPKDMTNVPTPELRMVERDLTDYLDRVRDVLTSNRASCVVCMDRAPTVITLPCKHKVLCRLCATQVKCCPVCRETAVELFEPVEI